MHSHGVSHAHMDSRESMLMRGLTFKGKMHNVADWIIGSVFPVLMVIGLILLIFIGILGAIRVVDMVFNSGDSPVSHYIITKEVVNKVNVTRIVDVHAKTACWSTNEGRQGLGCMYIPDEDITLYEDGSVRLWGASYCLEGHICE